MFYARLTSCVLLLVALVACTSGCHGVHERSCAHERTGVFVHISHDAEDAHAVLMGLKMANLMAEDRDVLVYFDLQGVHVVLKGAEDISHNAFDSSHTQLRTLIDRGVPLYVCPACLKAAGKGPGDVMEGVKVANKEAFFSFTNGRIITLDY
ncbi:MAG: DsrE family protein [Phycisphaerales bacterium]|nr:MAG: DsrE family protein [Phycisphaerales bacterium]